MTPAQILAAPHLKEVVDIGEGAPVFMATPLQWVPPVSFSPVQFHAPAPVEERAAA